MIGIIILISVILLFIIILGLAIYFLRKRIKKNKSIKENIPEEVMEDFLEAEKVIEESKGEITPQQILFNIWKKRNLEEKPVENIQQEIVVPKIKPKEKKIKLGKLFR